MNHILVILKILNKMARKIEQKPESRSSHGYTPFDLSKSIKFTSSVGQLLPVLYDRLDPGDVIKNLSCAIFTRTQPLNSAAFTRITEHVDYFFVPMKLINSFFGSQFYGIQDIGSSLLYNQPSVSPTVSPSNLGKAGGVPRTLPCVRMQNLYSEITNNIGTNGSVKYWKSLDEFGVPAIYNFYRLCSLLGYSEAVGLSRTHVDGSGNQTSHMNIQVSLDLFFAYQRIFYDYYRLSTFTKNNPFAYSADYMITSLQTNQLSAFGVLPSYLSLLANRDPISVNYSTYGQYNYASPFALHYRPWKKDFFTNVEPTPLYDINDTQDPYRRIASSTPSNIGGILNIEDPYLLPVSRYSEFYNDGVDFVNQDAFTVDSDVLTTSSLRLMAAWEKMQTITQRAGKHYNDQTLAHYGVSVPQGIADEVYYLGSQHSPLQIGEVVGTATTGSGTGSDYSVLGQIAGKGVSAGNTRGKSINFKAPCHGIMMAIYSAVPESDYCAWGIDQLNFYNSVVRYYHPEFDNLGLVPLPLAAYDSRQFTGAQSGLSNEDWFDILGWQYRYSEVKTKYDTIHGAFVHTLPNWVTPRSTELIYHTYQDNGIMSFSSAGIQSTFYINPSTLDPILELSFIDKERITYVDGDLTKPLHASIPASVWTAYKFDHTYYPASLVYANDPLLHNIDFFYHKSSKKSLYGTPHI